MAADGDLVGVVLAAGQGTRLRPLTWRRPKPLCPVLNRPLLDHGLDRVAPATGALAVNVCHGAGQVIAHLDLRSGPPVHVSIEERALGTAGAIGRLRPWIDGRAALIVNGDTWTDVDLLPFVSAWDGDRPAVLVMGDPPLHGRSRVVASLCPPSVIATLTEEPSGLWEMVWRDALAAGELVSVGATGRFVDCGTPADYLRANLTALADAPERAVAGTVSTAGRCIDSVIGHDAVIEGTVVRSVIGPGVQVHPGETMIDGIKLDDRSTVLVR